VFGTFRTMYRGGRPKGEMNRLGDEVKLESGGRFECAAGVIEILNIKSNPSLS